MEWTNEVVMEFLDLYEQEPTIWNPLNEDHKDRNKIYEAWKRIQTRFTMECSLKDLKNKKENLMATYRKLAIKVKKTETGSATGQVYKPEWFAYEKMDSFLHTVYAPRGSRATEVEAILEDNEQIQTKREAPEFTCNNPKRIKSFPDAHRGNVDYSPTDWSESVREDDCDYVGKLVASKLRRMNDLQRIHAEKLINDVLYKGMLEQLNETNYIGDSNT